MALKWLDGFLETRRTLILKKKHRVILGVNQSQPLIKSIVSVSFVIFTGVLGVLGFLGFGVLIWISMSI